VTARVAVVGSSHSAGLGVYGRSFATRAAELLGAAETLQLSHSAQIVPQVGADIVEQIADFAPTVIIVSFGAAEAHVHPSRFLQALLDRFAPAGWRGPDGIEPRPYFSRRPVRRLAQRAASRAKVLVKRLLIGTTGGFHRLPTAEFETRLRDLLDRLGPAPKVLVGLWPVDDRMFPRSNPVLDRNDAILRAVADERDDAVYVETAHEVRRWDDFLEDHAHLNGAGHDRVAALIADATRRATGDRADARA
jgi:lysophospholipase L1-like esterase